MHGSVRRGSAGRHPHPGAAVGDLEHGASVEYRPLKALRRRSACNTAVLFVGADE